MQGYPTRVWADSSLGVWPRYPLGHVFVFVEQVGGVVGYSEWFGREVKGEHVEERNGGGRWGVEHAIFTPSKAKYSKAWRTSRLKPQGFN